MYTFDDIKKIEKTLKKYILFFIFATLIFAAVLYLLLKNWGTEIDPISLPVWPAYIIGVLYAVFSVFISTYMIARLFRYRAFVYSILNGLEKTVEGTIIKIGDSITYDKDLEFYSIELKLNDKEQTRTLRLDAIKDIAMFEENKDMKLKVFGNYIKDILS
ncbi:MAG: hypothetical protein AB1Z23_05565 [Eubacteriales bacterium]